MKILLLFAVGISILCSADSQHADCKKIGQSSYIVEDQITCNREVGCPKSGIKDVNLTICCNGYKETEYNICQPECNSVCIHGTCKAPDKFGNNIPTCHCERGYQFQTGSDYYCVPYCSQGCGKYSSCTFPEKCKCNSGYLNNTETNSCEPDCKPECIKGKCTGPGVCTCDPGYKQKMGSNYECEPDCKPECINGTCSASGKCECNTGYTFQTPNTHICVPDCPNGCQNGDCNEPNKCECHDKYVKDEKRASVCNPICQAGCIGGTCVKPNQCECEDGYVLRNETVPNVCTPDCGGGCINSKCVGPNECDCLVGFYKDHEADKICHPHCTTGCPHGKCTGQEKCECQQGYVPSQNESTCLPYCSKECLYGTCIGNDRCECNDGYAEIAELWDICIPKCSSCDNGECTGPEECTCNDGYNNEFNSTNCKPSCKPDCIHGFCKEPNVCSCNEGTLKSGPFRCTPTCKEHPHDNNCYFTSSLSVSPSDYSLDDKHTSLMLSSNPTLVLDLPRVHDSDKPYPTVVNYSCFTYPQHEEVSVEIVCSIGSDTTQITSVDETVRPVEQITAVNLVILHRKTSKFYAARICSHSNREFHIDRLSHLSMCIDEKIVEGGMSIQIVALYSIVAIVLSSAVVVISAKCILNKKLNDKTNRISRTELIEYEPEEGELGVAAFQYSDMSDRLEDLK